MSNRQLQGILDNLLANQSTTATTLPWPTALPGDPADGGAGGGPGSGDGTDDILDVLLPLLILSITLLFLLLLFLLFLIVARRNQGIRLSDEGGPTNLEQEDEIEGVEGGLAGVEQRWMDNVDPKVKAGYLRSKDWQTQYPPNSLPTDITLSQFLSIQEKGVSAWSFEPDYESNPALIVQSRTEITFLSDGVGMADEEGGGCCVQSNLPLPRLNEVYYFECKIYEKAMPETEISIGLATKPFPSFRLPGWSKYSVGYFSSDGFKAHSYPFTSQSYGPPLTEGDVLGVGYRPRTGTVFFTRNGKKLPDAYVGLSRHNLFPTVGANGNCSVHVNLGQAGFVFIEANVKKWGLAPMMGTLAPPPAYGSERGSILLESANGAGTPGSREGERRRGSGRRSIPVPNSIPTSSSSSSRTIPIPSPSSSHPPSRPPTDAIAAFLALGWDTVPARPSPLRHSRRASSNFTSNSVASGSGTTINNIVGSSPLRNNGRRRGDGGGASEEEEASQEGRHYDSDRDEMQNPPTPGLTDISLHSIHRFPRNDLDDDSEEVGVDEDEGEGSDESSEVEVPSAPVSPNRGNVSPPAYFPIDPHRYAPGVGEAMLEEAFGSSNATSSASGGGGANVPNPARSPFLVLPTSTLNNSSATSTSNDAQGWMNWLGRTLSEAVGAGVTASSSTSNSPRGSSAAPLLPTSRTRPVARSATTSGR